MSYIIGIRREDKNKWERRVPLIPEHLKELKEKHGIQAIVQTSPIRVFSEKEYNAAGVRVQEDLSSCPIIFVVKEIPISFFEADKTYVFFAHVIKGQKYNMPMLRKMLELRCNLIDYEKITDEKNRRLLFFGRYAGLAGMVDTLWSYGQRMKWKGIENPLSEVKRVIHHKNIDEIKKHLKKIGTKIDKDGFPDSLTPFVIGFAGYGNVSKGAQEILDVLPIKEINPKDLGSIAKKYSDKVVYKVVFKEEDMVEHVSAIKEFQLQDYYDNPYLYHSIFHRYIPNLSILMNCVYWNKRYPRLVTKEFLKKNYCREMKLQVIGDISVDINGAIEFTLKTTNPGDPVFVYNPIKDEIFDGFTGEGIVVMAVDNLPCELPHESSKSFSKSLKPFVPAIVKADYSVDFKNLSLPPEIKKAVILYHGRITADYQYISKFL